MNSLLFRHSFAPGKRLNANFWIRTRRTVNPADSTKIQALTNEVIALTGAETIPDRKTKFKRCAKLLRLATSAWFLALWTLPLLAQNGRMHFERIEGAENLNGRSIRAMLQDSFGYIWIATSEGLLRYDGYEVKSFIFQPFDSTSLTANSITALHEDGRGDLWIGTSAGLCRLKRENRDRGVFQQFLHDPKDAATLTSDDVSVIYEARDDVIWAGTTFGLNRFDRATQTFRRYLRLRGELHGLSNNFITALSEAENGDLWVGTFRGGLNRLDPTTGTSQIFLAQHPRFIPLYKKYSESAVSRIDAVIQQAEPLAALVRLGNNADTSSAFLLEKSTTVLVAALGEAYWEPVADTAWLMREKNEKPVWQMSLAESRHAGGNIKNRWQFQALTLEPGRYNIHYRTDDSHAFGVWNAFPPKRPDWWGVQIWEIDSNVLDEVKTAIQQSETPSALSNNRITALTPDPTPGSRTIWIGTADGLNRFDPSTGEFERFFADSTGQSGPKCNQISFLLPDAGGAMWAGTSGCGLSQIDVKARTFESFIPSDGENALYARAAFVDASGDFWLATTGPKIYRLARSNFHHVIVQRAGKNSFPAVQTIFQDTGGPLWLGTTQGLLRYDGKIPGGASPNITAETAAPFENTAISFVKGALGDERALWIGSFDGELSKATLDDKHNFDEVERRRFRPDSLQPFIQSNLMCLLERPGGELWLGTNGSGLIRLNRNAGDHRFFFNRAEDAASLPSNVVHAVAEDHEGAIWVGTQLGGLSRLNPETETFDNYVYDLNRPTGLNNKTIHDLLIAEKHAPGRLWLGTYSGGLSYADPDGSKNDLIFHQFLTQDGLPSNMIDGMLEDARGCLWIASKNMLTRYDPEEQVFKRFSPNHSGEKIYFRLGSQFKNKRGELFFGAHNGFVWFHPDSVSESAAPPRIILTAFRKKEQPLFFDQPFAETEVIELAHHENFFTFEFTSFDYASVGGLRYAYKLEGFDDRWIQADDRRYASYTNVSPGQYTFRARAMNGEGVWSENDASVRVIIAPPFWQTWWFRTSILILIGGTAFGFHHARIRGLAQREIELKELVAERTAALETQKNLAEQARRTIEVQSEKLQKLDEIKSRFFSNITHEFRTPLTLILGPLDELLAKAPSPAVSRTMTTMRRNAKRLLRLINQLLDFAKIEAGNLRVEKNPGDAVAFCRDIVDSFLALSEQKRIQLKFTTRIPSVHCKFDHEKLDKILFNLLSNAFKFSSKGGKISLQLSTNNDQFSNTAMNSDKSGQSMIDHCLLITVKDTGAGIAEDKLPFIFDRFFQDDAAYKNGVSNGAQKSGGSGIGLALAKELAELCGGEITVISEPGKGSEFIVKLPIEPAPLKFTNRANAIDGFKTNGISSKNGSRNGVSNGRTNGKVSGANGRAVRKAPLILIIEDHRDLRTYIARTLTNEYEIITADEGESGLAQALENIPDLIISDVMMPGMDGFALCDKLKNDDKTNHIPVILLTAKASAENRISGLKTGADDYITKPFNAEELRTRVANLIAQRRLLREKFARNFRLEPENVEVESADEAFIRRICKIVDSDLDDPDFGAEALRQKLGMSKAQFHRKIRALTDQSPSQLIRGMRLKRARQLLEKRAGTVSEIAFQVGFNNLSYFAKCFREFFDVSPSEFTARNEQVSEKIFLRSPANSRSSE